MRRMRRLLWVLCILPVLSAGCAVRDQGTRTMTFNEDGVTIKSDTIRLPPDQMVDIEKEKTRQICYKELRKTEKESLAIAKTDPYVLIIWEQTKALNNAMSLLKTGKSYNPCPSSTNSSDVEIADAKMYSDIYGDAFSFLKFGVVGFFSERIADSMFGALASGGWSVNLNGDNGSLNVDDAFKNSFVGNNSTAEGILNNQTTEVVEVIEIPVTE